MLEFWHADKTTRDAKFEEARRRLEEESKTPERASNPDDNERDPMLDDFGLFHD